MKPLLYALVLFSITSVLAQGNNDPEELDHESLSFFQDISDLPDSLTTNNVLVRMIDGLGFRYYWVTEGLTADDLSYQPSPTARSCEETLVHILSLTYMIKRIYSGVIVSREEKLTYEEVRRQTLVNLFEIRNNFSVSGINPDLATLKEAGINYWHMINGPIADAIWHCGQVATFRRATGNQLNTEVDFLRGNIRNRK